jgi:hypothetical protein
MDGGPRDAGAAGARPWPEGFRAAVALIEKITQHGEIWLAPHVRDRGPGNGGNRSRAGARLR